jgi:ABC-2 type transport system permease protein
MNVYRHEFKSLRKSTIIWAISLSLIIVMFLSLYPAFSKDVAASEAILANFPPAIRAALGLALTNLFTIFGFYSIPILYIVLAGSVQAMNLGIYAISKEDAGKTADFLLSKPVTREKVLTSKILASLSSISITNVIYLAVALLMAKAVASGTFSIKIFVMISLTLLFAQLYFLALGTFLSIVLPKIKSAIAISLPVVFVFFIIGNLGSIIGDQAVRYISPFKFFNSEYIIEHNAYEIKYMVVEVIVISVAIILSYIFYRRKDIHAGV